MKDETKEILKYIDQFVYIDQTYNDIKLSKIDVKLILDYITNLQNRTKELEQINEEHRELNGTLHQEIKMLEKELAQWKKKYGDQ